MASCAEMGSRLRRHRCEHNVIAMAGDPFVLIGMAPSGEAFLLHDRHGRISLISILGGGRSRTVASDEADAIIARRDWLRLDRSFASIDELNEFRLGQVRSTPGWMELPDLADYDHDDIEMALEDTAAADSEDERAAARDLLLGMLARCRRLQDEPALRIAVAARLDALIPTPMPAAAVSAEDPTTADALWRMSYDYRPKAA
jgi:hypothetical protein